MDKNISVILNGKNVVFSADSSLQQMINQFLPDVKWFAVQINNNIIEKQNYSNTTIIDGDVVDIIQPVGGG